MSEMPEEELPNDSPSEQVRRPLTPTRILLRGLAVAMPAVLTLVILIWVIHGVNDNIVQPATAMVQYAVSLFVDHSVPSETLVRVDAAPPLEFCDTGYLVTKKLRSEYYDFIKRTPQKRLAPQEDAPPDWNARQQNRADWMQRAAYDSPSEVYVQLGGKAVPYPVFADVAQILPPGQIPQSARGVYMEYVSDRYFGSVIPLSVISVLLIIILLYFMGRFVSIRIGRWLVGKFEEQVLGRLPVVRNVYGSVKQVTDFVFTENQPVEYRRVIACQYPCREVWSLGFVTGESLMDIANAQGEPCVSILIPTSPMPMTGFTINVPKSQIVDLDLTVEQAMQFCISCGVLTPPHQRMTRETLAKLARSKNVNSKLPNASPVPPNLPMKESEQTPSTRDGANGE